MVVIDDGLTVVRVYEENICVIKLICSSNIVISTKNSEYKSGYQMSANNFNTFSQPCKDPEIGAK